MSEKGYYFYVLYCHDGTLYAGFTTQVDKRVATHNAGKGAKYTQLAKRRPVQVIYVEKHTTKSSALKQEAAFKKLTRRAKESYLANNGVLIQDVITGNGYLEVVTVERNDVHE